MLWQNWTAKRGQIIRFMALENVDFDVLCLCPAGGGRRGQSPLQNPKSRYVMFRIPAFEKHEILEIEKLEILAIEKHEILAIEKLEIFTIEKHEILAIEKLEMFLDLRVLKCV